MSIDTNKTSRRAMLAGLAIAPVAGLPAIATAAAPEQIPARDCRGGVRTEKTMSTVISSALGETIDRFKAARAAVKAYIEPEDMPDELTDAESQAVAALALAPCASADELFAKLRLLLDFERGCAIGGEFEISRDGSLAIALESYFFGEARP